MHQEISCESYINDDFPILIIISIKRMVYCIIRYYICIIFENLICYNNNNINTRWENSDYNNGVQYGVG